MLCYGICIYIALYSHLCMIFGYIWVSLKMEGCPLKWSCYREKLVINHQFLWVSPFKPDPFIDDLTINTVGTNAPMAFLLPC